MRRLAVASTLACLTSPVLAEVPQVLADTAPVHSLAALVMGDLGSPGLLMPPGTSPHDAGLTPSEARALAEADLILWTGPAFLPWMEDAVASLAPEARSLPLLDSEGWEPLPARESPRLGEGRSHDEAAIGPHAWLDPAVAQAWLGTIAEALAAADPENAAAYRGNAEAAGARLQALGEDLRARLGPLAGRGHAVGHDAYRYLERAAGLPAARPLAQADGAPAAPGDVAALREAVLAGEVSCLLLDAEADPAWADTLGEGTALEVATVDPDGVFLLPGPGLYEALMAELARAVEGCLAP